ncbi:MAG: EAL domain-containing protein [Methylophaga sp.]|nr:EAL domain-containing protein [Methylophaga sp.]
MAKPDEILRLLLIDDSLTTADVITTTLRSSGHTVRAARHDKMADIKEALNEKSWDLIICRDTLITVSPKEFLEYLHNLGRDVPCIILTTEPEIEDDLFDLGAQDIMAFSETKRLQFAVTRELKNLFVRRLGRRNERALRESDKRSQLLLEISREAVAYIHEGMHIYANQAYVTLFGYDDAEDLDGLPIMDMLVSSEHKKFKSFFKAFSEKSDTDAKTVSVMCINEGEQEFEAQIEFRHAAVEGEDCIQVTIREEQAELVSDEQVSAVRDVDTLTGLYSRPRFMDELSQVALQASENAGTSQLIYIVLDNFQLIKEQVGLTTSEAIVKAAAELLKTELKNDEFLARYSDQVFVVIIQNGDDAFVDERAERYRQAIEEYVSQADGKIIELKSSIGISRITENLLSAEEGLDHADKACAEAQNSGGNRVSRHQIVLSTKEAESQDKVLWVGRMQDALKNEGFSLHYQPIVSLHGASQELYDVLIRMKEPDGTVIRAREFMKYAQQPQLVVDIDKWVIENALNSLAVHRATFPKTRFFIKLSKQTLLDSSFINWLISQLKSHGFNGSILVFEISETAIIDNLEETQSVIAKLKKVGCAFGLEHFGSGLDFSHTLSVLDVEYLKINGSFVENMAKDKENQAAVKAIIEMTKQAGKQSIAEFVSDASSLALLWRLGVDYAMGYYIQKPAPDLNYNFDGDE